MNGNRIAALVVGEQSQERTRGKVNGGAAAEFHTPEDYPGNLLFKDWLLHIRRAER